MFDIKYLILEDEKERILSISDINEFENSIDTVVGQVEITFAEHKIGFVHYDVPYDGEFIVLWLMRLNEAAIYLQKYGFATICKPSSDTMWIEFNVIENEIFVSLIRTKPKKLLFSSIEKTPNIEAELLWSDKIKKDEFYCVIQNVTLKFLKEIKSLNELTYQLRDVINLIEINENLNKIC